MKTAVVVPGTKAGVEDRRYRLMFPYPMPMSAAYLAAVLEKNGYPVVVLDQPPMRLSNRDVALYLKAHDVGIVGISVLTTTLASVTDMVKEIRGENPGIKIVWGNQHATMFPDQCLSGGLTDYVVRGEGEQSFLELVEALHGLRPIEGVAGVSWVDASGRVRHNQDRPLIDDLDTIPYPAWHLYDIFDRRYMALPLIGVYSTPVPVMASRGCPYHCVFCSQDKNFKRVRIRKIPKLVDEIEFFVNKYGFEWFGFNDAYFPWTRQMGFEFAGELIRRGLNKRVKWITETRVDMVDEELLTKLHESGLRVMFFGFESGNQSVLDMTGKGTTLDQARAAAAACRKAGVQSVGFFMIGLPGDTEETCRQTVDFAIELDLDFAKFAATVPYPGSPLYEQMRDRIGARDCEKFNSWYNWASGDEELIETPSGLSSDLLLRIQREGMFKFYARPRQVVRHLSRGTIPLSFMLYGAGVLTEGLAQNVVRRLGLRS